MTAVAICNDSPQVSDGSSYASCVSVTWIDSSELQIGLFDGFTPNVAAECASAIIGLWALAWAFPWLARVIVTTR